MEKILDQVERFLIDDDWKYERNDEYQVIKSGIQGENSNYSLFFLSNEEMNLFAVYAAAENPIPTDKRSSISEFITRANYGMYIGAFEMDMDDGEIRFRMGTDLDLVDFNNELIENMLSSAVRTMDKYYPGLMEVSFSDITPAEAIDKIESDAS